MTKPLLPPCLECGFSTKAKTPGMAAYAMRKHSCEFQHKLAARAERAAARKVASGPEAPCRHLDDGIERHPHGARNRYVIDGCRCRPCRDADAAYERNRKRLAIYGRGTPTMLVDAQPVRMHVQALQAQGMGWQRIARTAGVPASRVSALIYGAKKGGRQQPPSTRMRKGTADALMAVRLNLGRTALIPAHGSRLRLRALAAVGWSTGQLASALDLNREAVGNIMSGRTEAVYASTRSAITDLYDSGWQGPPPVEDRHSLIAQNRARNRAAREGWLPPMALDDDRLDDPDYVPDVAALEPVRRTKAAEIAELVDLGCASAEIVQRLGLTCRPRQVRYFLERDPATQGRLDALDRATEFGRWSA